jgi:hypothetical protein
MNGSVLPLFMILYMAVHQMDCFAAEKVTWGGFALLEGDTDRTLEFQGEYCKRNYPLTWKLLQEGEDGDGISRFDRFLRDKVKGVGNDRMRIDLNPSENLGLGCVFALVDETILYQRAGDKYRTVQIELTGFVFVFDWVSKTMLSAYPSISSFTIEVEKDQNLEQHVWNLYTDADAGLFEQMITAFRDQISIPSEDNRSLNVGIEKVELRERIKPFLPEKYVEGAGFEDFEVWIANQFLAYLSKNQRVPVMPFARRTKANKARNLSILPGGKQMAMNFSGASHEPFMIQLPESDFSINLTIRGFTSDENQNRKSSGLISRSFNSYITVKAFQRDTNEIFMEEKLFNTLSEVFNRQSQIEKWPWLRASALVLFDEFAKQITKPEKKWAASHGDGRSTRKSLENFKTKVIDRCVQGNRSQGRILN